jgi:hypothetical protein
MLRQASQIQNPKPKIQNGINSVALGASAEKCSFPA